MQRHRSLLAWQSAHEGVRSVFAASFRATHPTQYPVYDQLRRAALSVQLNIAEGYALGSPKLFRRHLRIAYGSAVETTDVLDLMDELEILPARELLPILRHSHRTQGLVLGLLRSPNLRVAGGGGDRD